MPFNRFGVGVTGALPEGRRIRLLLQPMILTEGEAIQLAAWLVALSAGSVATPVDAVDGRRRSFLEYLSDILDEQDQCEPLQGTHVRFDPED